MRRLLPRRHVPGDAGRIDGGHGDDRLASLTLLAAEVDFTEAGELSIFIDDSQLAYLEDLTWEQGYLDGRQMSGAFTLLNSNDLIWSRIVRQYLMAEPQKLTDLSAWNVDTTRLPHRMHTEYLRNLYLNNDLASGRLRYDGRALALADIRAPIFLVGTERDHVAPWKSVYMLHLYADADITFCLTKRRHNVGIVNPPQMEGGPAWHFRIATKAAADRYVDPDQWYARQEPREARGGRRGRRGWPSAPVSAARLRRWATRTLRRSAPRPFLRADALGRRSPPRQSPRPAGAASKRPACSRGSPERSPRACSSRRGRARPQLADQLGVAEEKHRVLNRADPTRSPSRSSSTSVCASARHADLDRAAHDVQEHVAAAESVEPDAAAGASSTVDMKAPVSERIGPRCRPSVRR